MYHLLLPVLFVSLSAVFPLSQVVPEAGAELQGTKTIEVRLTVTVFARVPSSLEGHAPACGSRWLVALWSVTVSWLGGDSPT